MTKKIISILLSLAMISSTMIAFADDDTDSQGDEAQWEIDNSQNDIMSDEYEIHFVDDAQAVWPIPDFDTTGMTDTEILRNNLFYYFLYTNAINIKTVDLTIDEALSLYIPGGYFPGLDYTASSLPQIAAARHFRYLGCMVVGYRMPESKYYKDEELYKKIIDCFTYWADTVTLTYRETGKNTNWWTDIIGAPMSYGPTLILAYDILPKDLIKRYTDYFLYDPDDVELAYKTGTNGTWVALYDGIIKGALDNDEECVQKSVDLIINEMVPRTTQYVRGGMDSYPMSDEGLQTDGSWHQHGAKYYANYSGSFNDTILVGMLLSRTKFVISELYDPMLDAIIDGWRYIYRAGMIDLNHKGRYMAKGLDGVTKEGATLDGGSLWISILERMKKLYPERADEIDEAIPYFLPSTNPEHKVIDKSKYFYRSDYLCFHKPGWSVFNQLNSERTNATEHNTYEAFDSYWVGFGHTFLYKGEDAYYGSLIGQPIFWDWALIPGETTSRYIHQYRRAGAFTRQTERYAGGVCDSDYAVTAMKLTDRAGVNAKKSWFWFDDEFVSLGTGITANTKYDVNTCVEQRRLYKDKIVEVDGERVGKGKAEYKDASTVLHYGIGYYFPEKENIVVDVDTRQGSISNENRFANEDRTVYTSDMFKLYIPHGTRPVNDSYAYITIPETDSERLKEYSENCPIDIISNTDNLQAVYHNNLKIGQAAFYKRGTVEFNDDLKIDTDSICILMAREKDGKLEITVSNPYARKTDVTLNVTYKGKTQKLTFNLPGVDKNDLDYGGKSVTQVIE